MATTCELWVSGSAWDGTNVVFVNVVYVADFRDETIPTPSYLAPASNGSSLYSDGRGGNFSGTGWYEVPQYRLENCMDIPPDPALAGTTANNPIILKPVTSVPLFDGRFQVAPTPPNNPNSGKKNGYLRFQPEKEIYLGTEFNRSCDLYIGQNLRIRESIYLDFSPVNFQIEYIHFNRPLPWAHGGWYTVQVLGLGGIRQILEEEEIKINIVNSPTYRAVIIRYYEESFVPGKEDFKSVTIQQLDRCNFRLEPVGIGEPLNYQVVGDSPTLVGLNQIGVVDLDTWEYEVRLKNVGFYVDPGWELTGISHEIQFVDFAVRTPTQIQLGTPYTCANAP